MQTCGILETATPCNEIDSLPFTIRAHWERPDSRGYADYIPSPAFLIEYYRIEVSESRGFQDLVVNRTCQTGQADDLTVANGFDAISDFCNFDERVAILTGLEKARV